MFQLIETIRIQDGRPVNLSFHVERYSRAMMDLFAIANPIPLGPNILCPESMKTGITKCRVVYGRESWEVSYEPYRPKRIGTLRLVEDHDIDYSYKYADRSRFATLKKKVTEDEILIVQNGYITDISFANVALKQGYNWYTPRKPLLRGTRRESLIRSGLLREKDIHPEELANYEEIRLINAMIELLESDLILPCNVY